MGFSLAGESESEATGAAVPFDKLRNRFVERLVARHGIEHITDG